MYSIELKGVSKSYGDFKTLQNINLQVQEKEFFSILGPSGCGKTTLLRIIAGLTDPTEGELLIHGKNMQGVPLHKRSTVMIFQNLALFPNMNVYDNISFGLLVRGYSKQMMQGRVEQLLEIIDLPGIAKHRVQDLSGGQRQRVAIARALAIEPSVLLLDEPLSALDLQLRHHMRKELRAIQQRAGISFVYITHDQGEAFAMSDRVAVLNKGQVEQISTPETIYNHPTSSFVADFVGETNKISGKIVQKTEAYYCVETVAGPIYAPCTQKEIGISEEVCLYWRPERSDWELQQKNAISGHIIGMHFEGPSIQIDLEVPGSGVVKASIPNRPFKETIEIGQAKTIFVDPSDLAVFPRKLGDVCEVG